MISAPGSYCIPLVYGNAIKGGITNEPAYKTTNTGQKILSHFVDHEGNPIHSPYINVQNSSAPAESANIVWTDASSTPVTNLTLTGSGANSYVKFDVPANKIQGSNTIIAIKNKDGKIMWSWHLWIAQPDVLNTTEVTNYDGQKFNFIQEPLGYKQKIWTGSTKDREVVMVKVEQTYGPSSGKKFATFKIFQVGVNKGKREDTATFYQFGRKDAFSRLGNSGKIEYLPTSTIIADCIQNPDKPYPDDLTSETSKSNLWSMEYVDYKDAAHSVKTIYDPCPAGFKVPEEKAFTGFTTTGKKTSSQNELNVTGAYNNGWNFNNKLANHDATVFFPNLCKGEIINLNVSGGGNYWTATGSRFLLFFENRMDPRSYGSICNTLAIFPVAE